MTLNGLYTKNMFLSSVRLESQSTLGELVSLNKVKFLSYMDAKITLLHMALNATFATSSAIFHPSDI